MLQSNQFTSERRDKTRLPVPCSVFVHIASSHNKHIKTHTMTDNFSLGGLYLQIPYRLTIGSYIFTFTYLPGGAAFAAQGTIVRIEEKENGLFGVAVCFYRQRLLPVS